jgi:hypothetical protein
MSAPLTLAPATVTTFCEPTGADTEVVQVEGVVVGAGVGFVLLPPPPHAVSNKTTVLAKIKLRK